MHIPGILERDREGEAAAVHHLGSADGRVVREKRGREWSQGCPCLPDEQPYQPQEHAAQNSEIPQQHALRLRLGALDSPLQRASAIHPGEMQAILRRGMDVRQRLDPLSGPFSSLGHRLSRGGVPL